MSCRYKNECPSYSGWCEGQKQDFSRYIEFLITAYEGAKKVICLRSHRADTRTNTKDGPAVQRKMRGVEQIKKRGFCVYGVSGIMEMGGAGITEGRGTPMDKDILRQYTDLQQEIRDLQKRIDNKTELIKKMEEKGYTVKDAVKGTRQDGILGSIVVEGFPHPDYTYQKSKLHNSLLRMRLKQDELLELTGEVEKFIDGIQDSRTRRIFRYRYLDNMNWVKAAHCMGKNATAESCRKTHDRFLEEK